jgi:hypothetical protein
MTRSAWLDHVAIADANVREIRADLGAAGAARCAGNAAARSGGCWSFSVARKDHVEARIRGLVVLGRQRDPCHGPDGTGRQPLTFTDEPILRLA